MICKNCGKQIAPEEAYYCPDCASDYCPECASSLAVCSCYGELKVYS